jgi:hypothetical protein
VKKSESIYSPAFLSTFLCAGAVLGKTDNFYILCRKDKNCLMNACFNTEFYLFMHVTQNIQFFVKRFETHTGCEDVGAAFFLNLVTRLKKKSKKHMHPIAKTLISISF